MLFRLCTASLRTVVSSSIYSTPLVQPVCLRGPLRMQSSINSFFKPKSAESTPEKSPAKKPSSANSTPTKVTPTKSPKSDTKKSPKLTKDISPEKVVAENEDDINTKTITPTKAKRSPPSKKRKAASDEESEGESAKKLKEDKPEAKRTFSSDTLLDDDDTLATIDLDAIQNASKPTTTATTTTTTSTTNSTPIPSSPKPSTSKIVSMSAKPAGIFQMAGGIPESVSRLTNLLTDNSWKEVLKPEFRKDYFTTLAKFLESQRAIRNNRMYPPEPLIFNALNHASFDKVRVVILGQDPYINYNQAMGFSFSVPRGTRPPPSLANIFKELSSDIAGFTTPNHGDLTKWADQGVLLLNAVLTVREKESNSHKGKGWENLTSSVINAINLKKEGVVFMLWGKDAQTAASGVNNKKHLVLKAAHPSPFAADKGFFGCKHFSKANAYLTEHGQLPIDWSL